MNRNRNTPTAGVTERSNRMTVRNPMLALPAVQRLTELDEAQRSHMRDVLLDIRRDAQKRAEVCWRKHKAPMAAYWKVVSVYAGHIAKAINRLGEQKEAT